MKFAHYKKDGRIAGYYSNDIDIPEPNISLSESEWLDCINNTGKRIVDINTKKIIEFIPPPIPLSKVKDSAIQKVAAFATETRAKLADNADFYEVGGWPYKRERALRFKSGDATPEDSAILQMEIDNRGKSETLAELIDKQLARSAFFESASVVVDGLVSAGKRAINNATNKDEIKVVLASLKANAKIELNALLKRQL